MKKYHDAERTINVGITEYDDLSMDIKEINNIITLMLILVDMLKHSCQYEKVKDILYQAREFQIATLHRNTPNKMNENEPQIETAATIYYELGQSVEREHNYDDAIRHYKSAIKSSCHSR